MSDDRTERLELKLAFLERANQELSDVVYRQQQDLDALKLQVRELLGRIEDLREEPARYTAEQEKPPHY
ncbi:MAG TPA: SlyX family protein [Povalibacter sp.]|uniref:SlyX family protein n=1 Tax=Povalibacter sp. TaxID=1962978 RepID=UPI002C73CE32|nr:SlyX family protein [Povalibacter sp.]HMN47329.1 SlyX family protein [Povalibacter sp.]